MKNILFLAFLLPLMAIGQNNAEYGVFETAILTPNPTQLSQFEKGLAAHNKKFHGDGPYGARVYWISNGPNTGSYTWVMGPFPWSALDNRPAQKDGHDADWDANVTPYLAAGSGETSYWRAQTDVSRFPKDFTIKNMTVNTWDIKRGKNEDVMKLVKKVQDVYAEKSPNEIYGIYTNEFPSTKEGRDLSLNSFFDKSAWLGQDNSIAKKYDEMNGAGSWAQFLKDWMDVTNGGETELWIFQPNLSGINGEVKAAPQE